ncbi:MAG TPA: PilZ domain-containing protein [Candidatus Polarisedimenticolia bacterium]|nr:PilZ domain-containing protein [Candidatus Polarisedimenticolia bacterium]
MTAPGIDKRKGKPRIQKRLSVRFGTEAKMVGGNVVEISEGGMRIESVESFPVHSILTVFVQFPRHAVRLRARVIWSGGSGESSSNRMGLALTQPEPALKLAYSEWVAEVKKAASEAHSTGSAGPAPGPASPSPQAAAAPVSQSPAPPPAPEPTGPVRRRLESRQGQSYDALLERQPPGWQLTIVQLPRQVGVGAPDFQSVCPDYASAEKALREFVRTH